ncbi:MAG: hypothetical protein K1X85_09300 [Ignavibacteria bacterium]|nr:hypothetical protein [Ignavibacteria bacterium]
MIVRKKKRDVKFIIYQSLYILVISSLAMNHMTLSNLPQYTKIEEDQIVIRKPEEDKRIEHVGKSDTIVEASVIPALERKIDSLEKVKTGVVVIDRTKPTPTPRTEQPKTDPPVVPKIKGGEKKSN